MSDLHNCKMEERIRQLEQKMQKNSEEHKEFYSRLEQVNLKSLKLDIMVGNLESMLKDIANDVKELKDKPLSRGEKFTSAVITAIGSSIGTGVLLMIVNWLSRSV